MRTTFYLTVVLVCLCTLLFAVADEVTPPVQSGPSAELKPAVELLPKTPKTVSLLLNELNLLQSETQARLDELAAKIDRASAEQQIQLSLESAAVKRQFWIDTILVRARYARDAGFYEKAQDLEATADRLAARPATGTPRPRSESPAPRR